MDDIVGRLPDREGQGKDNVGKGEVLLMGYPAKGRDRTTWRRRGLFLWATLPQGRDRTAWRRRGFFLRATLPKDR